MTDGHSEADLSGALLRHLCRALSELGREFCFAARSTRPRDRLAELGRAESSAALFQLRERRPHLSDPALRWSLH